MTCAGLASATANAALATISGVFSCTAPTAAANLAAYYNGASQIVGTSWKCIDGVAPA